MNQLNVIIREEINKLLYEETADFSWMKSSIPVWSMTLLRTYKVIKDDCRNYEWAYNRAINMLNQTYMVHKLESYGIGSTEVQQIENDLKPVVKLFYDNEMLPLMNNIIENTDDIINKMPNIVKNGIKNNSIKELTSQITLSSDPFTNEQIDKKIDKMYENVLDNIDDYITKRKINNNLRYLFENKIKQFLIIYSLSKIHTLGKSTITILLLSNLVRSVGVENLGFDLKPQSLKMLLTNKYNKAMKD